MSWVRSCYAAVRNDPQTFWGLHDTDLFLSHIILSKVSCTSTLCHFDCRTQGDRQFLPGTLAVALAGGGKCSKLHITFAHISLGKGSCTDTCEGQDVLPFLGEVAINRSLNMIKLYYNLTHAVTFLCFMLTPENFRKVSNAVWKWRNTTMDVF